MSVHEAMSGFDWIYTTLSADSTLTGYAPGGIWRGMAKAGTTTPFIILSLQAGTDVMTMNGVRLMDSLLFQAKAVGPTKATAAIVNAASQLDSLIALASGTITGGTVLSCYREQPLALDEIIAGELWLNLGGLYRILIQQS